MNTLEKIPKPVALITVMENIMPCYNYIILEEDPLLIGISVNTERFTHYLLNRSFDFGINFVDISHVGAINYTGRTTGEHTNKFYGTKLTKKPAKLIRSYLIEESILSLECVKKDKISFSEHTLFIGQVVNVESKDGEFKIPLAYDYRRYTYQSDEVIEF